MSRTATAAAIALIATALVGCGPTPTPTPSTTTDPAPAETVSATPEPEDDDADPVVAPLTIPDCETLLPIALARSAFADSTEFLAETVATEYYPWFQSAGTNATIAALTVARSCWWGIPNSDGAFSLLVAEVSPAAQATIEADLVSQGFSSTLMGTLTVYENGRDGEVGYEAETHLFTGNVWILADDGSLEVSGIVVGSALDALRTANPTMGL